ETDWNLANRFQGQSDVPLNARGHEQAAQLAAHLATEKFNAIYASDLNRAWDTAQAIAAHHTCPLITEPRLREGNFGKWEGCTFDELEKRDPERVKAWMEDVGHFTPPDGETLHELAERVAAAYADIAAKHTNDEIILIVAHGGSMQMLIRHLLNLPINNFWQFHLSHCSVSKIAVYPEGAIINLFNDICHLD
nr:alpha-ribazole phosphatase [Anaerolineae bacterium]